MSDIRILVAAGCLKALNELFLEGELSAVSIQFDRDELLDLLVQTTNGQDILIESLANIASDPLQAVVDCFNRAQDYLADNEPTRAEARPRCRDGHRHPAICQIRDSAVTIVCPKDASAVRQVFGLPQ